LFFNLLLSGTHASQQFIMCLCAPLDPCAECKTCDANMLTVSTERLCLSMQVRWLRDHEVSDTLLKELMEQSTQVWSFIMEREIESPERFQAIQSYRAAMAVLRQQVHYIEQLRDSGMIDEAEEGMLLK